MPFSVQILFHVLVEVFKHEIKFIFSMTDIDQINNSWVVEFIQKGHFSNCGTWNALIAVLNLDFLQSNGLIRIPVDCFPDHTVSALADLLN